MNKRRIIISALVGTIALTTLSISISLAWYGARDRLNIDNLEINVSTKGNLRISRSAELDTFVSDLKKEDFDDLGDDFLFAPVSSMCKSEWMNNESTKATPIFYDCSEKKVFSSGEPYLQDATFGYFQQDLYLLTSMRNQYAVLYFDNENYENGTYLMHDKTSNEHRAKILYDKYPEWGLNKEQIVEKLNNLEKSIRFSILVNEENFYRYYIVDPFKESTDEPVYYGGLLDNDRNGYFDTYRDNSGHYKEIVYGEVNDRSKIVYGNPVSDTAPANIYVDPYNQYTANSFEPEFGNRPNAYTYNKAASEANGFEIVKEDSLSFESLKNDDSGLLIPLTSGVPTKIVLSIYLEGWDHDCVNATMGASFISKLSFMLKGGNV